MVGDDTERTAHNPPATRRHRTPREVAVDLLAATLLGASLVLTILFTLVPYGTLGRSHLADIALLLGIAGLPFLMAAIVLSIQRRNAALAAELWRRLRPCWSLRAALIGGIAACSLAVWLDVADLLAPPVTYGVASPMPLAAQWAYGVALILTQLSVLLTIPESAWRSWRGRRARRSSAGPERR